MFELLSFHNLLSQVLQKLDDFTLIEAASSCKLFYDLLFHDQRLKSFTRNIDGETFVINFTAEKIQDGGFFVDLGSEFEDQIPEIQKTLKPLKNSILKFLDIRPFTSYAASNPLTYNDVLHHSRFSKYLELFLEQMILFKIKATKVWWNFHTSPSDVFVKYTYALHARWIGSPFLLDNISSFCNSEKTQMHLSIFLHSVSQLENLLDSKISYLLLQSTLGLEDSITTMTKWFHKKFEDSTLERKNITFRKIRMMFPSRNFTADSPPSAVSLENILKQCCTHLFPTSSNLEYFGVMDITSVTRSLGFVVVVSVRRYQLQHMETIMVVINLVWNVAQIQFPRYFLPERINKQSDEELVVFRQFVKDTYFKQ